MRIFLFNFVMISFLTWNCRGIGSKPTQRHVYNTCRMNKVKLLAILEPKVAFDENFFTRRLGFHKAVSNCSNFIWLFADFDLDFEVVWDHEQFIHVVIRSNLFRKPIWCTFVYDSCSRSERRNLWDCIFQIASVNAQEPWLIGGDFNIIMSAQEKRGGAQPKFKAMEDFADMVLECGLIDAGFEGATHTWSNRITWERLDRFLYSEAWLDTFTTTRVIHLSRTWSDHAPLLIYMESNLVKPPSSFRLKQHLKWWNKNVFGDLFDNIKKAQEQVLISESLYDAAPSDANLTDLNRANADLTKLLAMEEDFWRQKATYVLIAVQDFFCCTPMPKNFKATSIALIPKVLNPSVWTDYRPISLCNVSNKICSKIMNDRLSRILPRIIAPSQSGFVGGRLISDNILLAQELIHTLDEKRRYENVVYKLDMAKAYDRVQWQFLYNVLRKMGFNEKWIQLVKNCIEQCWFSVLVNGDKAGFFSSSRGLRQGDPISPLLFIILAEYLARGLDQLFHRNQALRYNSKGGSDVNHLSFADDIIIFSNASRRSIRKTVDFLDSYQRISGQLINIGKSSFIVGNKCSSLIKQRIQNITGFVSQSLPLTYLGTPLHKGNKKCILYDDLITRMRAKLLGWKQSMLSHGGRLALIKSTLCSMPLHLIQVLNPPKAILHCIEQIMAKFFWSTTDQHKKLHWSKWKTICQPVEEGGLGIWRMSDVVTAFTFKLWWRFWSENSLWAKFLKAKYCKGTPPSCPKASIHNSPNWRRMCKVHSNVQEHIFWILGNGMVSFWFDNWIGEQTLSQITNSPNVGFESVNYYWRDGTWDKQKLDRVVPPNISEMICNIPILQAADDIIK
ncbi:LINE-1 retrotransposable element O protein [Sesamum angolense]|uniref:LINE-1 retrotransposable element O protein n=1 Tax=Sesamum angolense TaxID=2727404 RepID=A0AAE2BQV5_9LAMI|nr:LINE-1 retrotransposable element O protein [Sesamum angolense]